MESHSLEKQYASTQFTMKEKMATISRVFVPLFLAGAICVIFRQTDSVVFRLLEQLQIADFVFHLRKYNSFRECLPSCFIFSLPGGLWAYSFTYVLGINWNLSFHKASAPWLLYPCVSAAVLELLQYLNITDGRYDIVDILFYMGGALLAMASFEMKNTTRLRIRQSGMVVKSILLVTIYSSIVILVDQI